MQMCGCTAIISGSLPGDIAPFADETGGSVPWQKPVENNKLPG
jgi:hypothetical protein